MAHEPLDGTRVSQILIRRRHSLTRGQARRVANAVAEELATDYGVQSSWTGDSLHFKRTGLDGTLRLSSQEFTLDVRLGFVLAAFRDRISEAIRSRLELTLSRDQSRSARGRSAKGRSRKAK